MQNIIQKWHGNVLPYCFIAYFLIPTLYAFRLGVGSKPLRLLPRGNKVTFHRPKMPVNSQFLWLLLLWHDTLTQIKTQHAFPFCWGQEKLISATAEVLRETRRLTKSWTRRVASLRGVIVAVPLSSHKHSEQLLRPLDFSLVSSLCPPHSHLSHWFVDRQNNP